MTASAVGVIPYAAAVIQASMRARTARLASAGEQNAAGGENEHPAEQRERVAVAHDQRLAPDRLAKCDDGLAMRGHRIADAAGHEIFGHEIEPVAHGFAV